MNRTLAVASFVLSILGAVLLVTPSAALAFDSPRSWSKPSGDPLAPARKAIDAKDWDGAIRLLEAEQASQPRNADVYNLLGFCERNRGHLDAAFAWYDKALALNPKHRGAHEYVGEAWLMAGNVAKAREHLAALAKLCDSKCEEYSDLREDIEKYEREHPK